MRGAGGVKLPVCSRLHTLTPPPADGGISGAVAMLASAVFWTFYAIIVLAIYQVNFNSVFVPLSSLILGEAGAVAPRSAPPQHPLLPAPPQASASRSAPPSSASSTRSSSSSSSRPSTSATASRSAASRRTRRSSSCRVRRGAARRGSRSWEGCIALPPSCPPPWPVNVLTTWFVDSDGKRLVARNNDLSGMSIINKRHSPNASLTVHVAVDQGVSAEQLRALHAAVSAFARARPLEWRPKVSMSIGATDANGQPPNQIDVAFSLTHHASWQEPAKISAAHAELAIAVLEVRGERERAQASPSRCHHRPSIRSSLRWKGCDTPLRRRRWRSAGLASDSGTTRAARRQQAPGRAMRTLTPAPRDPARRLTGPATRPRPALRQCLRLPPLLPVPIQLRPPRRGADGDPPNSHRSSLHHRERGHLLREKTRLAMST